MCCIQSPLHGASGSRGSSGNGGRGCREVFLRYDATNYITFTTDYELISVESNASAGEFPNNYDVPFFVHRLVFLSCVRVMIRKCCDRNLTSETLMSGRTREPHFEAGSGDGVVFLLGEDFEEDFSGAWFDTAFEGVRV